MGLVVDSASPRVPALGTTPPCLRHFHALGLLLWALILMSATLEKGVVNFEFPQPVFGQLSLITTPTSVKWDDARITVMMKLK